MKSIHQDFIAGARDSLPILLGVVPFATICSVAAVSVGLTPFEAIGMTYHRLCRSVAIGRLAIDEQGSPWLIMMLTAWVINVRFTMYSATLAPYLQKEPLFRKAPFAYMLSDQAFGVTMSRFSNQDASQPGLVLLRFSRHHLGNLECQRRLPGLCWARWCLKAGASTLPSRSVSWR